MDAANRVEPVFSVPDIYCDAEIITAIFLFMAGQKFGGMGVPAITRIKEVDEENRLLN
jgi:hypothetical protein